MILGFIKLLFIASLLASVLVYCALVVAQRAAALVDDNEPSP